MPHRLGRFRDWMSLTVIGLAFEAGDWATARAQRAARPSSSTGCTLIFRLLRDAELALGEGDDDLAAERLELGRAARAGLERAAVASGRTARCWASCAGAQGELERGARGGRAGARRARGLHRRRHADRAGDGGRRCGRGRLRRSARATCVSPRPSATRSRERGSTCRRLRAAAQTGGPVERAWREVGAAELATRARPQRPSAVGARRRQRGMRWSAPTPRRSARWREAEAHVELGERPAATRAAGRALEVAQRLGARWLESETRALRRPRAARASRPLR